MSCWDCIQAGIREQESKSISRMRMESGGKMLIFNVSGPMPDGLFELCKLLGLVNND